MVKLSKIQDKDVKKEIKKQLKERVIQLEKKIKKRINKNLLKKSAGTVIQSAGAMSSEFRKHASTALIAALSFLIALAWKDLIVKVAQKITPPGTLSTYPYLPELYTAIIVTIFAIIGIMLVSRWVTKPIKNK